MTTEATICSKLDCQRKADWGLKWRIPAKGWSIDLHQPLTLFCEVPLCRDHAHDKAVAKELLDNIQQQIKEAVRSIGFAGPDIARAWGEPIRRSDPEFAAFIRTQEARRVGEAGRLN